MVEEEIYILTTTLSTGGSGSGWHKETMAISALPMPATHRSQAHVSPLLASCHAQQLTYCWCWLLLPSGMLASLGPEEVSGTESLLVEVEGEGWCRVGSCKGGGTGTGWRN